jgi:hypothetical protein
MFLSFVPLGTFVLEAQLRAPRASTDASAPTP